MLLIAIYIDKKGFCRETEAFRNKADEELGFFEYFNVGITISLQLLSM
jgi:hypothetical protein